MPNSPLVSVIMPVYNHERYVAQAIESVLSQTYRPIEFIIIDDGSKDASATKIQERLDSVPLPEGVTVHFKSRPNKGAHVTINEGLDQANGDYLTILNSDDAYHPERLERCLHEAQAQEARLAFTYVEPIGETGALLGIEHPWRDWYARLVLRELDVSPSISSLLLQHNIGVSTGNFLFHRSLFEEVGAFSEFRYAHDVDFLLRVSLIEEPILIREALYFYRLHGSNTFTGNDHETGLEYEEIVYRYLKRTLLQPPRNVFAPSLDRWPHVFSSTPLLPHLSRALDRLVQVSTETTPTPENSIKADTNFPSSNGREVTLVSHELSYSGAPVLLRDIAQALRQEGVNCDVLSLRKGPLKKEFADIGCAVATEGQISLFLSHVGSYFEKMSQDGRVPTFYRGILSRGSRLLDDVSNQLRRWRFRFRKIQGPILINSFLSWPIALDLLEKRRYNPAFWYIHETCDPRVLLRNAHHYRRFQSLVADRKVALLFGSDATRKVWAKAGFDGEVRYWSGLPRTLAAANTPVQKTKRVVLSVQSTGTRKGTWWLLEAFALGRQEGWIPNDVELRIVGCHPPSRITFTRDLLRRAHEEDLRGAVRLVGTVEPHLLDAHYREAEVYVQSSIMECLPLALLNAMAHGLPIVSSDADGCREAILDGRTGRLVPPRQVRQLAHAIGDLLENPDTASAFGNSAKAHFQESFALEATVTPLLETLFPKQ